MLKSVAQLVNRSGVEPLVGSNMVQVEHIGDKLVTNGVFFKRTTQPLTDAALSHSQTQIRIFSPLSQNAIDNSVTAVFDAHW